MEDSSHGRFVRVPTPLFEAFMRARFSGGQYRILLWVIRKTYGWNRLRTPFTWYAIAKELRMHRAAVYRAAQCLKTYGVLVVEGRDLSMQPELRLWNSAVFKVEADGDGRQLWMVGMDVAGRERKALPGGNAGVACKERKRSLEATLFRRAKDSSKDNSKTYIKTGSAKIPFAQKPNTTANDPRQHLAGSATPIPGKYERLSQN
jgi:phage replication O-like protein O